MSDAKAVIDNAVQYDVAHMRAEEYVDALPNACVNLAVLDIPYFKVVDAGHEFDHQWETEDQFIGWVREQCVRWQRVLAPNGSIYVFAKPQPTQRGATMASRIEAVMAEQFAILGQIVWRKEQARHKAADKETLRAYFPQTERIIFAEQYGADSMAMGESQYSAKCDELRGFIFEPLRAYLDGERERAGLTRRQVDEGLGNFMSGHYFSNVQWTLPTRENYEKMRVLFNSKRPPDVAAVTDPAGLLAKDHDFLKREHDILFREYEILRREYDDLRAQFEALRRPFSVTADVPYTDVWDYPTVMFYEGKHPCEKPPEMARDIVLASSRPGDVVADFFAGSGRFLEAAVGHGRRALGCDMSEHWATVARGRCAAAATGNAYKPPPAPTHTKKAPPPSAQLGLFG
jgi:site-specific DNA-methyltransferase (adenine-specific)